MEKSKFIPLSWLFLVITSLFLVGCPDHNETNETIIDEYRGNVPSPDTGADNYSDDVVTGGVGYISPNSATIYGYVNNNDPQSVLGMGIHISGDFDIMYNYLGYEELKANKFDPGTNNRRFTVSTFSLKPGTTYKYYAFAGQKTAKELSFTTPKVYATIGAATDITPFSATIHGSTNVFSPYSVCIVYGVDNDSTLLERNGKTKYTNLVGSDQFTVELDDLMPGTTYYYYGIAGKNGYYGWETVYSTSNKIMSFTTPDICPDANHPHAIDLGLPSGTKWACSNVGASRPTEFGGYFAWGETDTKNSYTKNNYYQRIHNSNIAGTEYDAATANWGTTWQMPTDKQLEELVNNTTQTYKGVGGVVFRGGNGKFVYIPAAGCYSVYRDGLYNEGEKGYYWSSVPNLEFENDAIDMDFYFTFEKNVYVHFGTREERANGYSIRPVRKD